VKMWKKHNVKLREQAKELYLSGKSCKAVAEKLKIGKDAVYGWAKQDGFIRTNSEAGKIRPHPKLPPEKLVTKDESRMWKKSVCSWCKKEFYARKRYFRGKPPIWTECCSTPCRNKYHNKGYVGNGYKMVAQSEGSAIFLYRVVMEQKLGRKLTPKERVHHVDLDKSNDEPNNLHLCKTNSEHGRTHASLYCLVKMLLQKKIIGFNNGRYFLV